MYFSRGNPVVYYGDEQGFTGAGGDQDARQDMFPSQCRSTTTSPTRSRATTAPARTTTSAPTRRRWTTTSTPAIRSTASSRGWPTSRSATRRCATAPSSTASRRRRRASTRSRASTAAQARVRRGAQQRRAARDRRGPDVRGPRRVGAGLGDGAAAAAQRARRGLTVDASAAVGRRLPRRRSRSRAAARRRRSPRRRARGAGRRPARGARRRRRRLVLRGHVLRQGRQRPVAGHRHRRQRALPRLPRHRRHRRRARSVQYKAVVLDNAGHTRESATAHGDDRAAGDHARGAERGPARARQRRGAGDHRAGARRLRRRFERSVNGGAFTTRRHRRLLARLHRVRRHVEPGRRRRGDLPRRAHLRARQDRHERHPHGRRSCRRAWSTATIHYKRHAATTRWGLHLFGDGLAPGEATAAWTNPTPFEGTDAYGVARRIGIADDTKRVGLHRPRPAAGANPNIKDTGPTTASSSRSPRRRSGCGRATRGSTAARRRTTPASCRRRADGVRLEVATGAGRLMRRSRCGPGARR